MVEMTPEQLMAAGHDIQAPVQVVVRTQEQLTFEKILRVLPGKRIVAKAVVGEGLNKKTVLAKLFFRSENYEQECAGYRALKAADTKTPQLLEHRTLAQGGLCYYEFLPEIKSFDEIWRCADDSEKKQWLDRLLGLYEQLYRSGIAQQDCHFGNFVLSSGDLYCLDPAGCVKTDKKHFIYKHLAGLVSQFDVQEQHLFVDAICGRFGVADKNQLERRISGARQKRKKSYLQKIFRSCTEIYELHKNNIHLLCRRDEMTPEFMAAMENPDAIITSGKIIKDSRSTTVASAQIGAKCYVIKRYHNDTATTAIRRRFGKSRADNNWYFAHLLRMYGIPTPKPVALVKISNRFFDHRSYYVSEYIEAENAYNAFVKSPPTNAQIKSLSKTFAIWRAVGIEHGDCKTTNWLARDSEVMVVDLDAMREKKTRGSVDAERFLRDWEKHPALLSLFEDAIKAGRIL